MRISLRSACAAGCLLYGLSPASAASQIVGGEWAQDFLINGYFHLQRAGQSVAGVGDQNGDGYDDFVIASHIYNAAGLGLVHSGFDGSLLRVLDAADSRVGHFEVVAAAGDVDLDGIGDVLAGAPNSLTSQGNDGSVFVYSGATGAILLRLDSSMFLDDLGDSVACAGDVDGDGHPDVIAGGPGAYHPFSGQNGLARVFSGTTGLELFRFDGAVEHALLGWAVCGVGDWNGDGRDDFAYSANGLDIGSEVFAGAIFVHSGADGSLLRRFDGESRHQRFGWDLDAADVDADGILDLVVGDPYADLPGKLDVGCVRVYSGATGLLIRQIFGERKGDKYGWSVARVGNLDGDGHDDLVVGIPGADPRRRMDAGSVHLLSGRTGGLLHAEDGAVIQQEFGWCVASAGDTAGDGFDHVLVGIPYADRNGIYDTGAVYCGGYQTFLTPSAASVSIASGGRILFSVRFPEEAGGAPYQFLLSRTGTGPTARFGLQVPLTPDPLFYRSSDRDYPAAASGFSGILSADGEAGASLLIPPGSVPAAMIGREIWFAVVARDWSGAGLYSSVARSLRFEP